MEIILLEKITKLGDPGDLVNVKSGYARNFLIPTGKAVRANEENLSLLKVSIKVAVSEEETLYGSIGTREIAEVVNSLGVDIENNFETQANELCNVSFDLSPHQLFIKNFLSIHTPYNSLLLYHGLGTGKT